MAEQRILVVGGLCTELHVLTGEFPDIGRSAVAERHYWTPEGEGLDTASDSTPEADLEARDLQLKIDMSVESMPLQRRTVFRLSRIQGLANDEIARRLGIQKKTVENHLNLALKELKEALQLYLIMLIIWVKHGH